MLAQLRIGDSDSGDGGDDLVGLRRSCAQEDDPQTQTPAKIDPETLEVRRISHHPLIEGFTASTTAIQIGNDIWLGTNRGEMIAYFPAPEYS